MPGNHLKSRLGHPMVIGVLLWSVLSLRAALGREPPSRAKASLARTLLAVVIGVVAWAVFAFYLHARWIGMAPFG